MSNSYKGKTGFKRLFNAFFFSIAGLKSAIKYEAAFRLEIILTIILVPIALSTNTSILGKALLISSLLFVLIIELINSAIEAAVDHTSLKEHELAKRAKDLGSAAVFLSVLLSASMWALILTS